MAKMVRKKYLCICEGEQEKQYLVHLSKLLTDMPSRAISFRCLIDRPMRLEKELVEYDSAAIFDFDNNQVEFEKNIKFCHQYVKTLPKKDKRKIYPAYSSVNFDLWLILLKENYHRRVSTNDAYIPEIRRIYNLGQTENVKSKQAIDKILSQITLDDVKQAIIRAENIRRSKLEIDGETIYSSLIFPNPDLSIHKFIKAVLIESKLFSNTDFIG